MRYTEGYTLLELLVTVAVVGILAALAVPSFTDTIDRNSRDSAMMDLARTLGYTRAEAVTQGRTVSICLSANQVSCAGSEGGDWKQGWIVFTDAGTAGTVDGEDEVLQVNSPISASAVITLNNADDSDITDDFLSFTTDGFLDNDATSAEVYFKLCAADLEASEWRAIWIAPTGRPTMSIADADGVHDDVLGADLECP